MDAFGTAIFVAIFIAAAACAVAMVVESVFFLRYALDWWGQRLAIGDAPSPHQLPFSPRAWAASEWLWWRMLAIARGSPPPDREELAEHFAPSVFEQVPAEQLIAQLAPTMPLVIQLVEEASSGERYSALLVLPNLWLRYSCLAQDDEPHLLIAAAFPQALARPLASIISGRTC